MFHFKSAFNILMLFCTCLCSCDYNLTEEEKQLQKAAFFAPALKHIQIEELNPIGWWVKPVDGCSRPVKFANLTGLYPLI